MKIVFQAIAIVVFFLCVLFAMGSFTYFFFAWADYCTIPELFQFLGLMPWIMTILSLGIYAIDKRH